MTAWIARVVSFFRHFLHRRQRDKELDDEVRFHIEMLAQENIGRGMRAEEAWRAARLKFGGAEQVKERVRDARAGAWLETFLQDVRFGLRMLRKNPGFTAVAVLTLALGIGANTAIFSLIDALLLRSLPVRDPQQLVMLQWSAHKMPQYNSFTVYSDCVNRFGRDNPTGCSFSHPFFDDVRAQANAFSGVTASGGTLQLDLSGNGIASIVQGLVVSGNYFDTLGVRPTVGRTIEPPDEDPSAAPIAVLSNGYWQRAFGGSLSVVGKTVGLNGVPTTIVGVAERRFIGLTPGSGPDVWLPLSLRPRLSKGWNPKDNDAGAAWLLIIGRLKPDVSRKQAEAPISLLFRNEMLHGAQSFSTETDAPAVSLLPVQTGLVGARGKYSTPLFILMVAVGIVLLVASANVAGLLLARSTTRQKEMAVRLALGAGRGRIVRQLLTESILLSAIGGALGILLAVWGAHAIVAFVASSSIQPLAFDASIDTHVLLFTAGISLLTGIVFGLAPALRGTRIDLTPALKDGGGSAGAGRARNNWFNIRNALVVGQVALTMIVLVGAGLIVRTLENLRSIDPGFDASNILNFSVNPALIGYKGTQLDTFYRNLQVRLSAIPSVMSASYSQTALLNGDSGWTGFQFHLAGAPENSGAASDIFSVGPDFFATMKISFFDGRDFSPADFIEASASAAAAATASGAPKNSAAAPPSVPRPIIVNQSFVRRYLGNADPLGQRLENPRGRGDPGYVVIGVVRNAKYNSLRREINPTAYVPTAGRGVVFELRTANNPASITPAVRGIVSQMDSNLPISDVMTGSESIDRLLFQERFVARFSSFFGVLALVLACIGLYGLLSYEVTRRTREIGIRMALGAGQRNVLRIVVGQGLALVVTGVLVGIGASLGVTRYLGSILFDVHPSDPITLAAVAAILLLVSFVACFIPARRAMKVDPMVALRYE